MNHLQSINKALKQLEFIKDLPNQKGIVEEIQKTLKDNFELTMFSIPYFDQVKLKTKSGRYYLPIEYIESFKYSEKTKHNHQSTAIKEVLLKAKEHHESQAISTTDS